VISTPPSPPFLPPGFTGRENSELFHTSSCFALVFFFFVAHSETRRDSKDRKGVGYSLSPPPSSPPPLPQPFHAGEIRQRYERIFSISRSRMQRTLFTKHRPLPLPYRLLTRKAGIFPLYSSGAATRSGWPLSSPPPPAIFVEHYRKGRTTGFAVSPPSSSQWIAWYSIGEVSNIMSLPLFFPPCGNAAQRA